MKAVGEDVGCLIIVVTGKDSFFMVQLSFWSSLEKAYSISGVFFLDLGYLS